MKKKYSRRENEEKNGKRKHTESPTHTLNVFKPYTHAFIHTYTSSHFSMPYNVCSFAFVSV